MSESRIKIAGVAGNPISHSLSPRLHGYWLKKYGIKGDYAAFHVATNELPDFIARLKTNKIEGINLTVPHKEHAMSLVDEVDEQAKKIGAINTLYFDGRGKLIGTNTDGYGFLKHLKSAAPNWSAKNGPALIIGAGGAARAAISSLLAENIPEIILSNRTLSRAEKLAGDMNDSRIKVVPWAKREEALKNTALLVNVTTLGMTGQPELELNLDNLPKNAVVYDIVYNPLDTELLKQASARGNATVDGLGMLLHQAAPGFKAWFGVEPEVDEALRNHLIEALK
ncbi:MAG: shikimate dehydrogenase [Kordiimonadaceae bacterium]|jgi:shikimate dehydrogenase|nr:shikimate dehydrogenase [Kordiimonadaceae bacterium]MBT6035545.1 shikimate dehydrogenase [Kordiimonadaceae bacterium]MBT6330875.1 shikimate dehydrogenase [Kordiimonadaceae bacterium]MBT7582826.1 shikimate dehydrogenase [Kordiimonadaceae bacterium]